MGNKTGQLRDGAAAATIFCSFRVPVYIVNMNTPAVKMVKTPEKLAKFVFSNIPVDTSSVMMPVKNGHGKYQRQDYANWNGWRR